MTLKEKIIFHQVHPAKLATDSAAAVVSLYFFWQHRLVLGLLTHFNPPLVASAMVLRYASLQGYKGSRAGAYLLLYMTPAAQVTRSIGDLITVCAAWLHAPFIIAGGFLIIIAAWGYGLLPLRRT
jgi:hypothetical protein